jgi:hypothetical protein
MIMIIPDLSLVIVTTAGNWFGAEKIFPFSIVSDYIIPSVNRQNREFSARMIRISFFWRVG